MTNILRALFFFSFIGLSGFYVPSVSGESFTASPTGVLLLEKKHPFYLFVPEEYTPEQGWPLVVLPVRGMKEAEQALAEWQDWAKKEKIFLLVATVLPREGTIPMDVDRWLMRIKQEALERYHIASSQILLVGVDTGAPYAGYLGLRYPEEFSAAALFRDAWTGGWTKLARGSSEPSKQIPFYIAMDPEQKIYPEVEARAAELERKGYPVTFDPLKKEEKMTDHRDRMIQWFRERLELKAAQPENQTGSSRRGLRERIKENLFEI